MLWYLVVQGEAQLPPLTEGLYQHQRCSDVLDLDMGIHFHIDNSETKLKSSTLGTRR